MPDFLNDKVKEDYEAETSEEVLTSVEDRLNKLGLTDDEDNDEDGDVEEKEELEDKDEDKDKDEDEDEDEDKDEDEDEDEGGDVEENDEVVIPDNLVSAAKHQGWSEEEIVEFWQKDATLAKKTFDKMYEATNFISQCSETSGLV